MSTEPISAISPFFIVRDVVVSAEFYQQQLGFDIAFLTPEDAPFFLIVRSGSAQLMLKAIGPDVSAIPNHTRHDWAPWDAFLFVINPESLAAAFTARGAKFHQSVHNRDDGLRGFEIKDPDGYVLFFGRPV